MWFFIEIKNDLTELEIQRIATKIKNDDDFNKVLLNEFLKDGRFKGKDGVGVGRVIQAESNLCMEIGESQQVCWGSEKLDRPPKNPHVRTFKFTFARKFTSKPIITTGIHSNYSKTGDAFGVYNYSLNQDAYTGSIIEFDKNESPSPVTMQYFAIGNK